MDCPFLTKVPAGKHLYTCLEKGYGEILKEYNPTNEEAKKYCLSTFYDCMRYRELKELIASLSKKKE